MKKLLMLVVFGFSFMQAMEKDEPTFPSFNQLPQEIKKEVLTALYNSNLATALNPTQAVERFKASIANLRLVSKEFAQFNPLNIAIVSFMNDAVKRFPGQAVRIARLLNMPEATEWLQTKLGYVARQTTQADVDAAVSLIIDNKIVSLTRWLKQGYDPNTLSSNGVPLLFTAIENANLDAIKALVSYGADFNAPIQAYELNFVGSPLQLVQVLQRQGFNTTKLQKIAEYLRNQGALN
ncbi:hypothetical protein Noda2021_10930 [Candidatus Dependentiae bacterium Noda2021]|nr:hypothetical protein Noda2021_10930 [Candidatus Dependentiae bacterium Noda2021]